MYAKFDPFETEFWSEFLKNSVVILRNQNTMKLTIFGIFFDFLAVFSAACPACFWKFKQLAEAAGERGTTTGPTVSSAKCCFTLTNFLAAPSNNFSLTALFCGFTQNSQKFIKNHHFLYQLFPIYTKNLMIKTINKTKMIELFEEIHKKFMFWSLDSSKVGSL